MKNVIILFIVTMVLNKALCQSITIQPNDFNSSLNTSKIGVNTIKIEGKTFTDDFNFIYTDGSAQIKLIGNPNLQDISAQSNNTIDFLHGNNSRWSVGDFFSGDFPNEINSFRIRDLNNPQSQTPFEIVKGSNKVMLNNLKIGSLISEVNDGRVLKISTEGNVIAAPNQFLNLGALDLNTLGSGTITKNFSGSFGPDATAQPLYAPIHLPEGTSLVSFTVHYLDNSPNSCLLVSLISRSTSSSTIASVGSANVTSNTNNSMSPSSYFGSLVINNQASQYYFEIKPRNQANTAIGNWEGSFLRIVKIVLEYR